MNLMNTKILKYLLLAYILMPSAFSQNLYNRFQQFNSIMDAAGKVNPYYLNDNPAFMNFDGRDQLLSVQSSFQNENGGFKNFLDPQTERNYNLSFSGKRVLDSMQTFKGYFAINRLERNGWNWLATKNYNVGSPFLIGDSTTGDTRYNGIVMNAQYNIQFWKNFLGGISFSYYVDEGLKEVAPRPTSEHRDIDISAGLGYKLTEDFSIGTYFRSYNLNEKINYSQDEGALYQETILMKFRGYDLPIILLKKVETRYSYHDGYFGNIDLFYKKNNFSASGFLETGAEQIALKDDANDPHSEGYWKNNITKAGAQLYYSISEHLGFGVYYNFKKENMWARHPEFNVLLMGDKKFVHLISAGGEQKFNDKFVIGLELTAKIINEKFNDYYSDIFYEYDDLILLPSVGLNYVWSDFITTKIKITGKAYRKNDLELTTNSPSSFFSLSRNADLDYLSSDYNENRFYFNAELNPGFLGLINIHIIYQIIKANENSTFNLKDRSNFGAAIELKIKAY